MDRWPRVGPAPVRSAGQKSEGQPLLVAGALSLLLTLYPQAVVAGGQTPGHGTLMLCMWGIAAGFVHGVGFVPYKGVLRVALGPLAAWILILVGTLLLARG